MFISLSIEQAKVGITIYFTAMISVAISILRTFVAIQFSISIVVATNLKSIAHRESERSTSAASIYTESISYFARRAQCSRLLCVSC